MATPLVDLGLEKGKRIPLKDIFVKLAKTDFWHDFNESLMQELLDSASLLSSLSFKQRAENIARIRASFGGGNPTVQQYFMKDLDGILPGNGNSKISNTTERKLLSEIGVNFDAIESELKKWNQDHAMDANCGISQLPEGKEIQPTYSTVSRNYSYNVHPVKAYGQEFFLPNVFETQTGTKSFVLMIDASHYALSDIASKITTIMKEIIGEQTYTTKYKFYILNSTENDSDPATKISDIEIDPETNVEIFFLKDENYTSIYPSTFGDSDQQNENLYTAIGIESVRTDPVKNIITATLSGAVKMKIDDLGEMSKIDKASQKAVDSLIEQNGVTRECLSYFMLKRAGDWCQALCLLDKTRKYTVYQRQKVDTKGRKQKLLPIKEGGVNKTVSLQDLIDENAETDGITIALVTLDRILLAFALLLGIDVFFTTKYANLVPGKGGPAGRSIHWSIFFKNMDIGLSEGEKEKIKVNAAAIIKSEEKKSVEDIILRINTLNEKINTYLEAFPTSSFKTDIKTYLQSLHFYSYVKSSYVNPTEITDIQEQINSIQVFLEGNPAPVREDEILKLRNNISNYKTIKTKLSTIESLLGKLSAEIDTRTNPHPNFAKYERILNELISIFATPKNTDLRKSTCYNNFIEDIMKRLRIEDIRGLLVSEAELTVDFFYPGKPAGFSTTRKHDLMMRYLKEGILSVSPKAMGGGERIKGESWGKKLTLENNKKTIKQLFFKLRNKQILACNNYKWMQLNAGGLDKELDGILIGLKQGYITDKNGKYLSVLDNYVVTEDETKYFLGTETETDEAAFNSFLKLLEGEIKEGKKSGTVHLLMVRYIIMRDRLFRCDMMYNEYLSLLQQLNEEITSLIIDNPEISGSLPSDHYLQTAMLSNTLQSQITNLFQRVLNLKKELQADELFITFNPIGDPTNFYEYLNNIFNYLHYIRINIFRYSRRYYTPSTEKDFEEEEVADILLGFRGEEEAIKKIFTDIKTNEDALSNLVTAQFTVENKVEVAAIEAAAPLILANQGDKRDPEVINTIVDFVHEGNKLDTLANIATSILAQEYSAGGGSRRKRRTHKKKKRSAKRKTRKH